jgi:uncharacterized membrane protein YuzA (DUF378 family)
MYWAYVHIVAVALIVVGALVWGSIGLFRFNPVTALLGKGIGATLVYCLVGLAALTVAFHRDTYLPFLGTTVMPCSILKDQVPEHADLSVSLNGLEPGRKVLFWATEPATVGLAKIPTWQQAYLEFANAGVATVDSGGHVTLRIRKPQPYTVPMKGRLEAHVHWRLCADEGMLGPVQITSIPL